MRYFPFVILALAIGCTDINKDGTVNGVTGQPTQVLAAPVNSIYTVEYRVVSLGLNHARIIFGSSLQGTSELESDLPWSASFKTSQSNVFLYLYAQGQSDEVVRVQLFVNGVLFREASSNASALSSVEISGTFNIAQLANTNGIR